MPTLQVICPRCQASALVDAALTGQTIGCGHCGHLLRIAAAPSGATWPVPPPATAPSTVLPPPVAHFPIPPPPPPPPPPPGWSGQALPPAPPAPPSIAPSGLTAGNLPTAVPAEQTTALPVAEAQITAAPADVGPKAKLGQATAGAAEPETQPGDTRPAAGMPRAAAPAAAQPAGSLPPSVDGPVDGRAGSADARLASLPPAVLPDAPTTLPNAAAAEDDLFTVAAATTQHRGRGLRNVLLFALGTMVLLGLVLFFLNYSG